MTEAGLAGGRRAAGEPLARRAGAAVWSQIEAALAREIAAGRHAPGTRLATEHALAARFGVNRHTVRQAVASLAAKGLVRVEHGRGIFVEEGAIDYVLGRRTRYTENLAAAGIESRRELVRAVEQPASAEIAARLRLRPGARLVLVEALAEARGRPVSLAEHYFPARRFAGVGEAFARLGSISKALRAYGVEDYSRKVSFVSARLPDERSARLLRQPATRPVLHVESVNVDAGGRPIEFGRTQFAGDLVQLVVNPGA
jgi:GntR family phosphonate transport system transcriptional regulator